MKAVGRNILILPIKREDNKTKGGLILTDAHREDLRYNLAKVVTVGDDVKGLKDCDTIYYDSNSGFGIEIDKEKFKIIKDHDVVIIL